MEAGALAREIMSAYESGQMIEMLPSSTPGFDLDVAYEVEGKLKRWREEKGHKPAGWKVGYANKAMWRILKLETLVWGHMYDDTVHRGNVGSAKLAVAHPRSLKIEPEIVFGMKDTISAPSLDAAAALGAVDWMAIGFEIIDCPYPEWKFQPSDFVASLGLHAALVVGDRVPVRSEKIPQLTEDLTKFKVRMLKNGEFVEEGSGRNALRSPALCLAELGGAIAKRYSNERVNRGDMVSTGTLTAGHLTVAGDRWSVEVEGLNVPGLSLDIG